jgi:hypothetical protein
MSLDKISVVDLIGVEIATGRVNLSVLDDWDWSDETAHILALQEKINSYIAFIEEKQYLESYPDAVGRSFTIKIIGRFPLPQIGLDFIELAKKFASEIGIEIRSVYLEE